MDWNPDPCQKKVSSYVFSSSVSFVHLFLSFLFQLLCRLRFYAPIANDWVMCILILLIQIFTINDSAFYLMVIIDAHVLTNPIGGLKVLPASTRLFTFPAPTPGVFPGEHLPSSSGFMMPI